MPDDPNTQQAPVGGSLPLEPEVAKAIDQTGQVPPMRITMHPTGTGVVGGIAAGAAVAPPIAAPTHDIAADYHQQAQKDASIQTAIWAPHAASIEDEQNLGAAQAFGFDSETAHKLDQLHQGALNIGTMMGQAVPQSIQEVKDHPIVSALKTMGMLMNPPGAIASAAIGSTVEETLHQKYPEYPWIGTTAGVVSSLLSGNISGIGGEATAATKASTIVDEAGNPIIRDALSPIELKEENTVAGTPITLGKEAIETQRRGVQPQLESYANALKEHTVNPDDAEFQNLSPGTILNSDKLAELNIKTNTRVDNLTKLAKAYVAAQTPEQKAEALRQFQVETEPTANLIKAGVGVAAEHGRALALHSTDWEDVKNAQAILANRTNKDWDSIVRSFAGLDGPDKTAKSKWMFFQWLAGRPFYKALVNAQLMNPRIVGAKIATDAVYQPYNITAQAIGTAVHFRSLSAGMKLFTGATLASYRAIPDAWKFAKASMRSGAPEFEKYIGSVNSPRIFGQDYGNTIPGKAANWMASAYGIGTRAILGTDQFAKTVAYRAEMHTQAFYRGLEDAQELGLSGAAATRQALVQSRAYMAALPKWLLDKAEENMARDTFTDEDKYTQAARAITEAPVVGAVVRMVAPFNRTPINLLEQGMISSPMAGFTHKFWRDMGEGGLAADTDLAKMAMGSLFMGWMVYEASQGNITGQAPIDGKARDQFSANYGQEESLRIGDNMYSLSKLGVISTPIIMAANYAQYSAQMDPQDRQALAMAMVHAFARVVSEAPLLEPTMHLMDAAGEGLNSWDATGQPSKGAQRAIGKFVGEEISSFIPTPLKIAADAYRGEHVELNSMWDASKARIPGFGLPSHKDQYGYTQYLPHGAGPDDVAPTWYSSVLNSISPITVDHARNPDAIDKEEMRVGFVPSRVPNTLYAKDPKYPISLSPQEKDRWSVLAGHELKKPDTIDGTENLNYRDAKVKLINSDYYKNLADPKAGGYSDPDIAKLKQAAEIRKLHDGYIEAARVQMTGYTSKGFSGYHGENAELEDKAARRAKLEAPTTVVAN